MASPSLAMSTIRAPVQPRHVGLRILLCQACKDLANSEDTDGYINLETIKSQIDSAIGDQKLSEQDLLDLCDTEGSPVNGGGTFEVKRDTKGSNNPVVRWQPDPNDGFNTPFRAVGAPGEIGSPLTGHATLRGI